MNKSEKALLEIIGSVIDNRPFNDTYTTSVYNLSFELSQSCSIPAYYGAAINSNLLNVKSVPADIDITYQQAVVQDMTQIYELEEISQFCNTHKIRFMPVKGCVLKKYYPSSELRTMGDLDILIEPGKEKELHDFLTTRGYACEHFGGDHHDEYSMPPLLRVEIHRNLVSRDYKELNKFFQGIFDRATVSSENPYRYEMSEEDVFIYHLAHFYKHFNDGGAGIRFVIDHYVHYVLMKHFADTLDWEHTVQALKKLKLYDFHVAITELANAWFSENGDPDEADQELSKYIIHSGTFGSDKQFYLNKVKQKGRLRYFLSRLFPPFYFMKEHFPVLQKIPVLLPAVWVWRIISYPFVNEGLFKSRMRYIFKK